MYTKAFQKVPVMRKKHGSKVYEYGYVWVTLPPEAAGKPAVVKVIVVEEEQVEEKLLAPGPRPEPQPEQRPQPAPAQPAPPPSQLAPAQPLPPAQPLLPLLRGRLGLEPPLRDVLPYEEFTLEPEEEEVKRRRKWLRWP